MCQLLEVSRSSYYEWLDAEPSKRDLENKNLITRCSKQKLEKWYHNDIPTKGEIMSQRKGTLVFKEELNIILPFITMKNI